MVEMEPLSGGLRNSVTKLRLDSFPEPLVLRVFQHDPTLCQKELDLYRLIGDSVPVPEVIYAETREAEGLPPFTLARYVDGITFLELKRRGDREAIAEAAYSAGQTLAAVGRIRFEKAGWLGPGLEVGAPLSGQERSVPRFVDACLASSIVQRRMRPDLIDRTRTLIEFWEPQLVSLDSEAHLVHCDFSRRNLIVRRMGDRWTVVAVLDWEFAIAGSPLWDIANFLRYDPVTRPLAEPHFSAGFSQAGGVLPADWRHLARVLDLAAVCEVLTRDGLPPGIVEELVELVQATVDQTIVH